MLGLGVRSPSNTLNLEPQTRAKPVLPVPVTKSYTWQGRVAKKYVPRAPFCISLALTGLGPKPRMFMGLRGLCFRVSGLGFRVLESKIVCLDAAV